MMSMWSSASGDYGMTSMEADRATRYASECSDPPEESCSDAGCPVHGWDRADLIADEDVSFPEEP
jgi:hypothetical protein